MLLAAFTFTSANVSAQEEPVWTKVLAVDSSHLQIDSLSLVEESIAIEFYRNGISTKPDTSEYTINPIASTITIHTLPLPDSINVSYRRYPYNFDTEYFHKDPLALQQADLDLTPYEIATGSTVSFAELDQLQYNGSLVRGLSFGNNQDVVVNSSFNLQMSGTLQNDVEVSAAITDNNIPIQPDGNTQQLQEFDKVFIQLSKNKQTLIVGDFDLLRPEDYFLNYYKRTQGLSYSGGFNLNSGSSLETSINAAVVRGVYTRQFLEVIEGNQGPYKLRGENGENFIIVLAGTERVWLDGNLLTRGAENDYVIDYNSGEITFTPKQLVNKDKRIQIEFEYADNSYFRSIVTSSNTYTSADEQLQVRFNIYTEQDGKNQPLEQTLDSTSIRVLENIGDSILQAFVPGYDTIAYDPDRIMYRLADSLGFDSIFVYSTDPESAKYVVTFTEFGPNLGNYRLSTSLSNGRVYEWVAPIGGVPQGEYEPVILLTAPISRQMITLGGDYKLNKYSSINAEAAWSNNDVNTFSSIDNENNDGLGVNAGYTFERKSKNGNSTNAIIQYERIGKDFQFIERYRPVEFDRDWSSEGSENVAEHFGTAGYSLSNDSTWNLSLNTSTYIRETVYTGFKQSGLYRLNNSDWRISAGGSYLNASTDSTSISFSRPDVSVTRKFSNLKGLEFGGRYWGEHNLVANTDSLIAPSFYFDEFVLFANSSDTATTQLRTELIYRNDGLPNGDKMSLANQGLTWNFSGALNKKSNNRLSWLFTYRSLEVIDTTLSTQENENALLGRLQHTFIAGKGWLTSDIFAEIGTGQEPKREFTYVEVEPGQGTHSWNDYNNDGIQELNEFEIAVFSDQATFVQVFIPTDEYIQANTSQFNYVLGLNPKSVWYEENSLKGFIGRFSSLSTLQLNRKVLDDKTVKAYLPLGSVPDSQLVSSNIYWQNTVYFNRANPVFGADYTYKETLGKVALVNGPEGRSLSEHRVSVRYKLIDPLVLTINTGQGIKNLSSLAFPDRSYNTPFTFIEPTFTFLQSTKFRISVSYMYRESNNSEGLESLISNSGVIDFRYNVPGNSTISSKISLTKVDFEGETDSPVGFAMLEGLQNGNNILWNLKFDKRLSKILQLTLSYDGRKTGTAAIVHLGSVQMRAFF